MDFLKKSLKRNLLLCSLSALILSACSPAFAYIAEPGKSTLFVLLDGMAPSSEGLNGSGCKNVYATEAFGKTGVAEKLVEFSDSANVYYRPYLNPAASPHDLAKEFGSRGVAKKATSCKLFPQVGSILDDAQEHWFDVTMKEYAAGSIEAGNMIHTWIADWKKTKNRNPSYADLKAARPDLIPWNFVVVAHGMGGMVAREYIQSADYHGEISNVLFFDTPHEGTGFADQALLGINSDFNFSSKNAADLSAALPLVMAAYVLGGTSALHDVLTNLIKQFVLGLASDLGGDLKGSMQETFNGYSIDDPALWYLTQDADVRDSRYKKLISNAKVDVESLTGSTQYLNSVGKANSFTHPYYNVVYSYGLPTLGNGRRTFDDYREQTKNHVSSKMLAGMLADSLKNKVDLPTEQMNALSQYAQGIVEGMDLSKFSELGKYFEGAQNLKNMADRYMQGFSDLRSLKLNLNDLPETTRKILSLLETFIPEEYRSELFSSVLECFSPEYKQMVSDLSGMVAKGMKVTARHLGNYGLNFYDEGGFDVPSYSAFGGAVGIFKEAQVNRKEYSLAQSNKDLLQLFETIGNLEFARDVADKALDVGCSILEESGIGAVYGKICRAAEFATNVALVAEISSKTATFAKNSIKLRNSKYLALQKATENNARNSAGVAYSGMEEMLSGAPHISLRAIDSAGLYIPLLLHQSTNAALSTYDDLKKVFGDSTQKMYALTLANFTSANLNAASGKNALTLKIASGKNVKHTDWALLPGFVARDFVREYRFVIDDFMPQEMQTLRFDFNSKVKVEYYRVGSVWNVKMLEEGKWIELGIVKTPISAEGEFRLDLEAVKELYKKATNEDFVLASVQEDGPNLVSIYLVNKFGKTASQQFSYYFQATTPYIQEGWPKNLQVVSGLDSVDVHVSNLGNPYRVTNATVKLIFGTDTVAIANVKIDKISELEKDAAWEQKWHLHASFKDYKFANEGSYTILWNIATETTKGSEQSSEYTLRTNVFLDKEKPQLSFDVKNANLTNGRRDGWWGNLLNIDSSEYFALRAVRVLAVQNADTLLLASAFDYSGTALRLTWNGNEEKLQTGNVKLVAEAIDYATPSASMANRLEKDDSLWNVVFNGDGSFANGINGVRVEQNVVIDKAAPTIAKKSVEIEGNRHAADTVKVNADSLLKIRFDIVENLLKRKAENIDLHIYFEDVDSLNSRVFLRNVTAKNDSIVPFVFEEPREQKLLDGLYKIYVELIDEAGNESGKIDLQKMLVVDRTPPLVSALLMSAPVYATAADVDGAIAYLSQSADYYRNRSDLDCYWSVASEAFEQDSQETQKERNSKNGKKNTPFGLKFSNLDSLPGGRWLVKFGCYDAAGNFGSNIDVIGVGNRYPRLTYPTSMLDSTITFEQMVIRGIAPDPILPNGNEQTASFKIEWRLAGADRWNDEGISYLQTNVDSYERNLAVWNRKKLPRGDYEIRLTTCNNVASEDVCTSDIQKVFLNELEKEESMLTLDLSIGDSLQKAGNSTEISVLLNGLDTSVWNLDARVEVVSPYGHSKALGARFLKNDVVASPFKGVPAELKNGLTIFQAANGEWTVHWQGIAEPLDPKVLPTLSLKYQKESIVFSEFVAASKEDSSLNVASMQLDDVRVPAYSISKSFDLGKFTNGLTLKFKSDSAFIIDVSTIAHADSMIYCGGNSRPLYNAIPKLRGSKTVFVEPDLYTAKFQWNGLTTSGLYPEAGEVNVLAVATAKNGGGKVVTGSLAWKMLKGDLELVSKQDSGVFIVSKGNDSTEIITLGKGNFGYEFGLKGHKAYVSAFVKNDKGDVIKTLLNKEQYVAGTALDAYGVNWDGSTDNGFAVTETGWYTIEIVAEDEDGNVESIKYPFELKYAGALLTAPTIGAEDMLPILEMDEAYVDTMGNLRYVGRADYVLKANIRANVLPDSEQVFKYRWEIDSDSSYQTPALYEASRFSMGIRRKRKAFDVAVVTAVSSIGYDLETEFLGSVKTCNPEKKSYLTQMQLHRVHFDESVDSGKVTLEKLKLNNNFEALAYNSRFGSYPIRVALKVFPIEAYSKIKKKMGDTTKLYTHVKATSEQHIPSFVDGESWLGNSTADEWFSDFGQVNVFKEEMEFLYSSENVSKSPKTMEHCSEDVGAEKSFVCGAAKATEENIDEFNPHKGMLKVSLNPHGATEYGFLDDLRDCGSFGYKGTVAKNLLIDMELKVLPQYWNPDFGMNNFANRYTRWDHSNKTIYGPEGYFHKSHARNSNFKNLFNGIKKSFDENYGLVTPFETQYFSMEENSANPLLFSDEINDVMEIQKSKFQFKFFGSGFTKKHYRGIVSDGVNFADFSQSSGLVDFGSKYDVKPLNVSIAVAPVMSSLEAVTYSSKTIPYPYRNESLDFTGDALCNQSNIRDVDRCLKYYQGASRLHYGLNDWNESLWEKNFLTGDLTVRNPVSESISKKDLNSLNSFEPIVGLNEKFSFNSPLQEFRIAVPKNESRPYWYIMTKHLDTVSVNEMKTSFKEKLKLKLVSLQKNWKISKNADSVINKGVEKMDSIRYVRLVDSKATVEILDSTIVSRLALEKQNPKVALLRSGTYLKNEHFENMEILERDSLKQHPYFNVDTIGNSFGFIVRRNAKMPLARREKEIISLQGRIPGKETAWNLSYMKNGKILPIKQGVQHVAGAVEKLADFNVNSLQGNTSFFLTYGGSDGNVFFKQLDVHIGELVFPGDSALVQSMYGNVSVQFKPGSYDAPVDVTVRTATLSDYNTEVLKNVDPVGAIVEVLPSHVFGDSSTWPRVQVRITKESLGEKDPCEIKIYKMDFEKNLLVPLESIEKVFMRGDSAVNVCGARGTDKWDYALVSGLTRTFSTFAALDSSYADSMNVAFAQSEQNEKMVCGEMPLDSVWAGTANGMLRYPNPCTGNANYMLQLRLGQDVVVDKKGIAKGTLEWAAGRADIPSSALKFDSRFTVFDEMGSARQFVGPLVLLDTAAPKVTNAQISVKEDGTSRLVEVDGSFLDAESGVASVQMDLYWAGNLLESKTIFDQGRVAETFVLKHKLLNDCIGCKVSVVMTARDYGNNFVKTGMLEETVYPYPASLVLWYPLQDGAGNVAVETMGSKMDLSLSAVKTPWKIGKGMYLSTMNDVASPKQTWKGVDASAVSVEFVFKSWGFSSQNEYSILSWAGPSPWIFGIAKNGRYFFEYEGRGVTFSETVAKSVEEHLVLSLDGDEVKLYKDGVLADSKRLAKPFAWNSVGKPILGSHNGLISAKGTIADLRFYKAALSPDQVSALYQDFMNVDDGVSVELVCEIADENLDNTWVRPVVKLKNLGESDIVGAKLRYYYRGEGANVFAESFYPPKPMRVLADADDIYYAEFDFTESIAAHDSAYWGNGPQFGLHRDGYFPWNAADDPGVALLDAKGRLLKKSACHVSSKPAVANDVKLRALAKDAKDGSGQGSLVTMLVENTGTVALQGFEIRYYLREASDKLQYDAYYSPFARHSLEHVGGNLHYVSYVYDDIVLNPGERSDFGSGVNFELHYSDWSNGFDASDDPSHHGLSAVDFVEADSIVVLDGNGNLLWGSVPKPEFATDAKVVRGNALSRDGDVVYITVAENAKYVLEVVNAAGLSLETLFEGSWKEGVHAVTLSAGSLRPGSYLVLRKDSQVLSWGLLR